MKNPKFHNFMKNGKGFISYLIHKLEYWKWSQREKERVRQWEENDWWKRHVKNPDRLSPDRHAIRSRHYKKTYSCEEVLRYRNIVNGRVVKFWKLVYWDDADQFPNHRYIPIYKS